MCYAEHECGLTEITVQVKVGEGRWYLQEKAFSSVPWRCSGDDLGPQGWQQPPEQNRACPANSLSSFRVFVFKII